MLRKALRLEKLMKRRNSRWRQNLTVGRLGPHVLKRHRMLARHRLKRLCNRSHLAVGRCGRVEDGRWRPDVQRMLGPWPFNVFFKFAPLSEIRVKPSPIRVYWPTAKSVHPRLKVSAAFLILHF